jgi:tRNA (guanosine-2'-O-)-methyltransferase
MQEKLLAAFYDLIPENKRTMFDRIAADRTRHLTVVLENVYQEHNASAVMRSCESLGLQELHVIENGNEYKAQRDIARGAGKWIELYNYSDDQPVVNSLSHLKERGFRIAVLTPEADAHTIFTVPLDQPLALVFGTEWKGVSDEARQMADYKVSIPMYGFTESFNVSVSVALTLQALRHRLEQSSTIWKLSQEEQMAIKLKWCEGYMKNGTIVRKGLTERLLSQLRND